MKNILKFGATCALILGISALPAQARGGHHNDEALAAIGGIIGGVILSESLHNHQTVREEVYVHYGQGHGRYDRHGDHDRGRHDRFSKYDPRPGKGYGRDKHAHKGHRHDKCDCGGGRWKVVERRVYVPVSYTWRYNSCGVKIRVRQGGCYETVRERIWIGGHRHSCRFG